MGKSVSLASTDLDFWTKQGLGREDAVIGIAKERTNRRPSRLDPEVRQNDTEVATRVKVHTQMKTIVILAHWPKEICLRAQAHVGIGEAAEELPARKILRTRGEG